MRTPPLYNPARENEPPLPNILPPARNIAIELIEQPIIEVVNGDEGQNELSALFEPLTELEPPAQNITNELNEQPLIEVANGDGGQNELCGALFEPFIEEPVNQELNDAIDPLALIKSEALDPIHEENIDEIANDIIRTEDVVEAANDGVQVDNVLSNIIAQNENDVEQGRHAVDAVDNAETTNHSDEVVFEPFNEENSISVGEMPIPFFVGLQLKTNDEFSGKMHFVELVRRFRKWISLNINGMKLSFPTVEWRSLLRHSPWTRQLQKSNHQK